jgi:threonine aldolase
MYDRIADDHRRARNLAEAVGAPQPATNIVFCSVDGFSADKLLAHLARDGIRGYKRDQTRVRLVTHNDIGDADVAAVAASITRSG